MTSTDKLKNFVPRAFWPYLGTARRYLRSRPSRTEQQKQQLLLDPSLKTSQRDLLEHASSRIHYDDGMYKGDGAHYFKVGLSAIGCIDDALKHAGLTSVREILDLPCGYGRVLRLLQHKFADTSITACELDRAAVDFCVREFHAKPAYSSTDLSVLTLETNFDLIWCGSLITHLNQDPIADLFSFFRRHLAVGGLAVFTTHGDYVAGRLPTHDFNYGLTDDQIARITAAYAREGFAYTDYPDRKHYGVSLTRPEWVRLKVREIGGLVEVYHKERGWDNHQDVFGFIRQS